MRWLRASKVKLTRLKPPQVSTDGSDQDRKNKYRALKLVFFRLTDISAVAELGGVQHVSFKWAAGLKWKQMLPIKDYRGFEGRCGLQVLGIKLDFLGIK